MLETYLALQLLFKEIKIDRGSYKIITLTARCMIMNFDQSSLKYIFFTTSCQAFITTNFRNNLNLNINCQK